MHPRGCFIGLCFLFYLRSFGPQRGSKSFPNIVFFCLHKNTSQGVGVAAPRSGKVEGQNGELEDQKEELGCQNVKPEGENGELEGQSGELEGRREGGLI